VQAKHLPHSENPAAAGTPCGPMPCIGPGAHSATAPRPSAAPGAPVRGAKASRPDGRRPPP